MKNYILVFILILSMCLVSESVNGQRKGYAYGNCSDALDSAMIHFANGQPRYHIHSGGSWSPGKKSLLDSLASSIYGVNIITLYDPTTDCYNHKIRSLWISENGVDFWPELYSTFQNECIKRELD